MYYVIEILPYNWTGYIAKMFLLYDLVSLKLRRDVTGVGVEHDFVLILGNHFIY